MIDLNALGVKHSAWVERMGWHNKTVLESMALIASEIGEAAVESFAGFYAPERFAEELADITLRCVDLAQTEGVDLNAEVARALPTIEVVGTTSDELISELLIEWSKWLNCARKKPLAADFGEGMGKFVARVLTVAALKPNVDLEQAIQLKLAKNAINGTRGRII
jgi:NTP pyrophosphatase (non-canonical NTP hydrolase)